VPEKLGSRLAIDHKVLTRTTAAGNTAVLVVVETFSGFPHFIAVKDQTALTTAKALVHNVLPWWGTDICIISDKGPAFTSNLFKCINDLLGITHITSGARNSRCNGLAEAYVRRFSEFMKYYAKDDYSIEDAIPLIEILIRATPMSKLKLSPYEIVHARKFTLARPGQPASGTMTDVKVNDCVSYFTWLSSELKRVHAAVRTVREDIKIEDKERYDNSNKVRTPEWNVGDYVLLKDDSFKAGSSKVLTRQRYIGSYVIRNIVQGRPDVGVAYQLVDEKTAKPVKYLVTHDRFKKFDADRSEFNRRLPRLNSGDNPAIETVEQGPEEPKLLEIISKFKFHGKQRYKVLFSDNETYECTWVSKALLDHYDRKTRLKNVRTSPNTRHKKPRRD